MFSVQQFFLISNLNFHTKSSWYICVFGTNSIVIIFLCTLWWTWNLPRRFKMCLQRKPCWSFLFLLVSVGSYISYEYNKCHLFCMGVNWNIMVVSTTLTGEQVSKWIGSNDLLIVNMDLANIVVNNNIMWRFEVKK